MYRCLEIQDLVIRKININYGKTMHCLDLEYDFVICYSIIIGWSHEYDPNPKNEDKYGDKL